MARRRYQKGEGYGCAQTDILRESGMVSRGIGEVVAQAVAAARPADRSLGGEMDRIGLELIQ